MSVIEILVNSYLVSGVTAASTAVFLYAMVGREVRLRPDAWWVANNLVYMVYAPLITVAMVAGAGLVLLGIRHSSTQLLTPPGIMLAGIALLVAGAAVLLRIRAADAATASVSPHARPAVAAASG